MSIVATFRSDMAADTNSRTALLDITTPLAGLVIPVDAAASPVVVVVSSRQGLLTADLAPGAVVNGNGSNLLWIRGSAEQVNAKLATLTYASATVGIDDLSIFVLAENGTLMPAVRTTVTTLPLTALPSDGPNLIYFDTGVLTLQSRTLDGPNLMLSQPAGTSTSTTSLLIDSTIGAHSMISVRNDNPAGAVVPRLAMAGRVELDGAMSFAGNGTAVTIARGSTFINEGSIAIDAHAAQFTGAGTLINNGRIMLTGGATPGTLARLDIGIAGTGTIELASSASVEIGASVAANETISLGAGANIVHLAQPGLFAGQIAGFAAGDQIVLDGATVTSAVASHTAETDSATITLFNGTSVAGTLRFSDPAPGTIFQFGTDPAGNATIGLATVSASADGGSVDIFRFFDTAHGTQLLTQDSAERDAIIAGRPDLRYEGVGLHGLDPAQPDPDATAVFRFFDLSNGTHFMTASASERDTLLATRPSLVFEPGSTVFEHATAQAGDTPVYRFFDTQSGAHFFTADAGERASILATRPDMTAEGVAFYAPSA